MVETVKTFASLFSGGGGADCGAQQAGYTPLWGIEFDAAIAESYTRNVGDVLVSDARSVDFSTLVAPGWLHASPPCTNASQAKADAGETTLDRELALAVCRAIQALRPAVFTLENVFQYRTFDAFGSILQALRECGYSFDYWHLNSANYGVPQTRKRLILIAKLGEWNIQRPEPTHRDGGDMFLPAWVGWYEAIEDLIPTLPESRFAAWQLQRLPAEFVGSAMFNNQASDDHHGGTYGVSFRVKDEPALSVTNSYVPRAFIVDGMPNDRGATVTIPNGDEPMMTVSANGDKRKMRAFLIAPNSNANSYGDNKRDDCEPAQTVTTNAVGRMRAFLIDGANTSEDQAGPGVGVSAAHEPTRCVNASNSSHWRAWLEQGRVVAMSSRALARFQSFPDAYVLPGKTSLACQIVGNAVPCLLMQRIGESL